MENTNCPVNENKVNGFSPSDNSPEAKRFRFKKYSEIRVNALLKTVELIGRLSNRHSYEYTPEQVEKVFAVIDAALDTARQKFVVSQKKTPVKFEL